MTELRFKKIVRYACIGIIIGLILWWKMPDKEPVSVRDYDQIAAEGILRITTRYGANTYFINRSDKADGFHYKLAEAFAQANGWSLEVIPEMDLERQKQLLSEGKCDLIADNILQDANTDTTFGYTIPIQVDRQVVVQRKQDETETPDTLCPFLKSQVELRGKTICIPSGSSLRQRISHLIEEIGDTIYIQEVKRYGPEQLLAMVSHGDCCYAVCEEEAVKQHIDSFPNLDCHLAFGFNQFYSWGVNKRSADLLDSLNHWLQHASLPKHKISTK